jgi:hypothetical protein
VQPRNADAIADLQIFNGGAFFHDAAGDFVSEDERFFDDARELRPVGVGQVQIGVAYAAGFDFDQHFVRGGLGLRDLFDAQWGFEFAQYGGFHGVNLSEIMVAKQACAEEARASASGTRIDNDFRLRPSASQEKFDGIAHPLGEFMRAG